MKRAALLLTALAFLAPAAAEAQCPNGAAVCAEVSVSGSVSGSVQIGGTRRRRVVVQGTPARPAQVVVQAQPARPAHVVVQAPPVAVPQHTVVVTAPPPPPPPPGRVVVVQPAPVAPPPPRQTVVVIEAQGVVPPPPQVQLRRVQAPATFDQRFGLHARLGAMMSDSVAMGGAHFGLRFRPSQLFAIELGVGGYGGEDFNNQDRVEIPVTVDGYIFLGRRRFQPYIVGGLHTSVALIDDFTRDERTLVHVGGQLGIGGELRVGRRIGLSLDVRGFIRQRVGGSDDIPEFRRSSGETTDTSVGALVNAGMTLYL